MEIEVISLGADLYQAIEPVISLLNGIQGEFRFRAAPDSFRYEGISFDRAEYDPEEVFAFLVRFRSRRGRGCQFPLALVDKPLKGNLFGSFRSTENVAVATLYDSSRFTRDARRFCSYYLLRYALSFANPGVRSHNRESDKDCYFHGKRFKPDLILSMNAGRLCDDCLRQLTLTPQQYEAFRAIADLIKGDLPYALVMKGGGIKGIAYAGALAELERYFKFDIYVGTSAGAIASVLLASKYSARELKETLEETDFAKFLDSVWNWPINFVFRGGFNIGDRFVTWIEGQLKKKIQRQGDVALSDLRHAVLYACSPSTGTVIFDSRGARNGVAAAFAARCSMSIPIFFAPPVLEGGAVYDGGLRHNFPIARFIADNKDKPFIALFLTSPRPPKRRWFRILDIYDVWMEGDERELVDKYAEGIAIIDPRPIGTVDFRLDGDEKKFLFESGRLAAWKLIARRKLEPEVPQASVDRLAQEVEALRQMIIVNRHKRARLKAFIVLLIAAAAGALGYWRWG